MTLGRPEHLSPSSIETFEQCPLKYRLSRIDGEPSEPTEATLLGNFVHSVLEALLKLPPKERTFAIAKGLLTSVWEEEYKEAFEGLVKHEFTAHQFKWKAFWCVENYFKMEDPTKITPAGVEEEIDVRIDGVLVKGFIDRWEIDERGNSVVTDYKTGKAPKPWFVDAKFKQLGIYAAALAEMKDIKPAKMRLLYVKERKVFAQDVTEETITAVRVRLVGVDSAINERVASGDFEPKTSRLCDWCDYKGICPAWN